MTPLSVEDRPCERDALLHRVAALRGAVSSSRLHTSQQRERPVIGIPASQTRSQQGRWALHATDASTIRAVVDAGGDPYIFPCRPIRQHDDLFGAVWQVLRRCDGLLLPGGDVDGSPGWSRETLHPLSVSPIWWEDWWKLHLAQLATLLGLPFLGICQGLQYWVVAQGGYLSQDIHAEYRGAGTRRACAAPHAERWQFNAMRVLPVAESILAQCSGDAQAIWGVCMHHQAVREAPDGLVVTAVEVDGLIGAVERQDGFFGVGVQWHPEQRDIYATQPSARALFSAFIQAARQMRASQRQEWNALAEDARAYLGASYDGKAALEDGCPRLVAPADLLSEMETQVSVPTPPSLDLTAYGAGTLLPARGKEQGWRR